MLARLLLHGLSFVAAPTVELTWSAGPECPSAQAAEQAIVERLSVRGFEGNVRVDVVVRESDPGWVASVTVDEAVRSIELQSCAEAARSVAVVVAIATVAKPAIPPAPVEPSESAVPDQRAPESIPDEPVWVGMGAVPDSPPPPRRAPDRVGVAVGAEGLVAY